MPSGFEAMGEAQDVMAYDLAREYAMLKRDHAALCDPGLIEYLTMGEGISASEYAAALDAADACRAFHDVARDVDALAMPSTLGEAPPASSTGSSAFIHLVPAAQPVDHLAGGRGPTACWAFSWWVSSRKIRACCTGRVAWAHPGVHRAPGLSRIPALPGAHAGARRHSARRFWPGSPRP